MTEEKGDAKARREEKARATTDADGTFRFDGLAPSQLPAHHQQGSVAHQGRNRRDRQAGGDDDRDPRTLPLGGRPVNLIFKRV